MASLENADASSELIYLSFNQDASAFSVRSAAARRLVSHPPPPPPPPPPTHTFLFRPPKGCFATGTTEGFRIYNCDPFKETFRRNFNAGGIGIVEMLFRCNILALVGGGASPRWPKNKVMIWDDHQNRCIGELSFRSDVRRVLLRRDRVIVVLKTRVYVYNFADLTLADHLETVENPRGLCVVSPSPTSLVLVCPGAVKGSVRVELYDSKVRRTISAHEHARESFVVDEGWGKSLSCFPQSPPPPHTHTRPHHPTSPRISLTPSHSRVPRPECVWHSPRDCRRAGHIDSRVGYGDGGEITRAAPGH